MNIRVFFRYFVVFPKKYTLVHDEQYLCYLKILLKLMKFAQGLKIYLLRLVQDSSLIVVQANRAKRWFVALLMLVQAQQHHHQQTRSVTVIVLSNCVATIQQRYLMQSTSGLARMYQRLLRQYLIMRSSYIALETMIHVAYNNQTIM